MDPRTDATLDARAPRRTPAVRGWNLLGATLLLAGPLGCGGEAPPLAVADVRFERSDVLGLSDERLLDLAAVAVFTLAVAREETNALGAPLVERRRQEILVDRLRNEVRLEAAGAGDDALEAFYRQNPEHELVVRHIVFLGGRELSEARREPALRSARAALDRLHRGERFQELAAELSEEPGAAERGGLLAPGRRGSWVPEFWDAASRLEEGEVSDVVETRYGFHVLRLESRRTVPFAEARANVAARAASMLPEDGTWEEHLEARREEIDVPRGEVERWWTGESPDDERIAGWEGGSITGADLDQRTTTLRAREVRDLERADTERLVAWVREAALERRLAEEATGRGIRIEPEVEEELQREWDLQVQLWLHGLGLSESVPEPAVAGRAVEILGGTGQNLRVTRQELLDRRPLLLSFYPVRRGEPGEEGRGAGGRGSEDRGVVARVSGG